MRDPTGQNQVAKLNFGVLILPGPNPQSGDRRNEAGTGQPDKIKAATLMGTVRKQARPAHICPVLGKRWKGSSRGHLEG